MIKKQFSERLKQYPGDTAYFQTLAKELKLPAAEQYRLFSVIGAEELQKLLPSAGYGHFLGEDEETRFKLNLHIHTSASELYRRCSCWNKACLTAAAAILIFWLSP